MNIGPFHKGETFYRGNLHGHSQHSDGAYSPQQVVEFYKSHGYHFTCLSDHLWQDERFAATSVLDATGLNDSRFLTIPSAELHCFGKAYDRDGIWHIVANGLPLDFAVASETETAPQMVQRAIDAGAYVTLAHPEWYMMTMAEAESVSHAHGVGIYNHSCVIGSARGSGIAIADYLLQIGKKINFTAADDSHFRMPDGGGGWVMVAASEFTADTIIAALKAGQYYSSTGLDFYTMQFDKGKLKLTCSAAISITISGAGHSAQAANGVELTSAEFDLSEFKSDWFRVSIRNKTGQMAWSNPFWFADLG